MYRSYRGSRRRGGCLIPILIALCVLAAIVLIFVQRNVSFTAEGMVLRVPFSDRTIVLGGKEEEPPPLVIEEPEQEQDTQEEEQPEPEPAEPERPEYETRVEHSLFVPMETVLDESAFDALLAQAQGSQIDTFVLEVKAESGELAFVSTSEEAINAGAGAQDNTALKNALTKLQMNQINAVAQVSCFRDDLVPRENRAIACRTRRRVIWLDPGDTTWLNPYKVEAREYIKSVINDLYTLGFKEIMLTNLSFPARGQTDLLYYDEQETTSMQTQIKAFITEVRALANTKGDLMISAFYDNQATAQNAVPGGQSLQDFLGVFYRIYGDVVPLQNARGIDMTLLNTMKSAMGENGIANRFVPVVTVEDGQTSTDLTDTLYSAQSLGTGCMLMQEDGEYDSSLFQKSN